MTALQSADALGTLQIESRIVIDVPLQLVWKVTVAIAHWPIWSPTVRAVQGLGDEPLTEGTQFWLKQPLQPSRLWQVTGLVPPVRAEWETIDTGPPFRAIHEVTREEDGTVSVLGLVAKRPRGVLAPAAALVLRAALAAENRALRRRCLAMSGNQSGAL